MSSLQNAQDKSAATQRGGLTLTIKDWSKSLQVERNIKLPGPFRNIRKEDRDNRIATASANRAAKDLWHCYTSLKLLVTRTYGESAMYAYDGEVTRMINIVSSLESREEAEETMGRWFLLVSEAEYRSRFISKDAKDSGIRALERILTEAKEAYQGSVIGLSHQERLTKCLALSRSLRKSIIEPAATSTEGLTETQRLQGRFEEVRLRLEEGLRNEYGSEVGSEVSRALSEYLNGDTVECPLEERLGKSAWWLWAVSGDVSHNAKWYDADQEAGMSASQRARGMLDRAQALVDRGFFPLPEALRTTSLSLSILDRSELAIKKLEEQQAKRRSG